MSSVPLFDTQQTTIATLCGNYIFSLPPFQRPYSWGVEQVNQLINDIFAAFTAKKLFYFIGSIVLIREDFLSLDSEIVDGQQRITTLTILLSALCYLAPVGEQSFYRELLIQSGNPLTGKPSKHRLVLRQEGDFFKKYIQDPNNFGALLSSDFLVETEIQSRIRENAIAAHTTLSQLFNSQKESHDFVKFLLNNCYLIVVSSNNTSSALLIFSSLNGRGTPLTPSDILKADVLAFVPEAEQEEYARKWEQLRETLRNKHFERVFPLIASIHDPYRKAAPTTEDLRKELIPLYKNPNDFWATWLKPVGYILHSILRAEFPASRHKQEIDKMLRTLNLCEYDEWIAPCIAFWMKCDKDTGTDKWDTFLNFLQKLEQRFVLFMLQRKYQPHRVTYCMDLIRDIKEDKRVDHFLAMSDADKSDMKGRLDCDVYLSGNSRLAKYLLLRLEGSKRKEDILLLNPAADITVEHIVPQEPPKGNWWQSAASGWNHKGRRDGVMHRLGNLVLLTRSHNSEVGCKPFPEKAAAYMTSRDGRTTSFLLTRDVASEKEWTKDTFEKRQLRLLTDFHKLWDLARVPAIYPPSKGKTLVEPTPDFIESASMDGDASLSTHPPLSVNPNLDTTTSVTAAGQSSTSSSSSNNNSISQFSTSSNRTATSLSTALAVEINKANAPPSASFPPKPPPLSPLPNSYQTSLDSFAMKRKSPLETQTSAPDAAEMSPRSDEAKRPKVDTPSISTDPSQSATPAAPASAVAAPAVARVATSSSKSAPAKDSSSSAPVQIYAQLSADQCENCLQTTNIELLVMVKVPQSLAPTENLTICVHYECKEHKREEVLATVSIPGSSLPEGSYTFTLTVPKQPSCPSISNESQERVLAETASHGRPGIANIGDRLWLSSRIADPISESRVVSVSSQDIYFAYSTQFFKRANEGDKQPFKRRYIMRIPDHGRIYSYHGAEITVTVV